MPASIKAMQRKNISRQKELDRKAKYRDMGVIYEEGGGSIGGGVFRKSKDKKVDATEIVKNFRKAESKAALAKTTNKVRYDNNGTSRQDVFQQAHDE